MEKGAEKTKIIDECVKACSYDGLRLKSYAIYEKLEIFPDHRACLITLSKDELDRFHYEKGDTEGLVNEALNIRGSLFNLYA